MSKTIDEKLFTEMMQFMRNTRRHMQGDPPPGMHPHHGPGFPGGHPGPQEGCPDRGPGPRDGFPGRHHGPHGHRPPVLSRERILSLLLDQEEQEEQNEQTAEKNQDTLDAVKNSDKRPQGLRQKQLTEAMRVNPSSMSEFIGRLEEDGYVERNVDPADKRATLISLTEKGRARACELQDERSEKLSGLFSPLSEEEKQELLRLLEKLRQS